MAHGDGSVELESRSVEFGEAGSMLRGTLYLPIGDGPFPGVVFAHGWGMCAGGDLERYAQCVAERGIAALTFDFRRLGKSDGEPRQELDPYDQIDDYRTALTWLGLQQDVDPDRLGAWGSSYSGGHVLVLAATDRRVKAVVSQVPTISGYETGLRKTHPRDLAALQKAFAADRAVRVSGGSPGMIQTVGINGETVAYPSPSSYHYMIGQSREVPQWRNETTLRSLELARTYEPGPWVPRIGPTPLLMIVARDDTDTPTDLQLDAYTQAREPKELLLVEGSHYEVYQEQFALTSSAAADWFAAHL